MSFNLRLLHSWALGSSRCLLRLGLLLGSLGSLGLLLSLDVVLVNVLLDVQERHLHVGRRIQQRLQGCIQVDVLTILQTLLSHILVHLLGHLRARNLLTSSQLQKLAQLLGNVQGLVEAVGGGASLCLLAIGVLNQRLDLAYILTQQLNLVDDGLQGNSVSHCYLLSSSPL